METQESKRLEEHLSKFQETLDKLSKYIEEEKDEPKNTKYLVFCINSDLPSYEPTISNLRIAFNDTKYGYFSVYLESVNVSKTWVEIINFGRWLDIMKEKLDIPFDKTIAICDIIHPDVVVDALTVTNFTIKSMNSFDHWLTVFDMGNLDMKEIFNLAVIIHRIIKYYQKYVLNTNEWYDVTFITKNNSYNVYLPEKDQKLMIENGFICTKTYFTRDNPSVLVKFCDKNTHKAVMNVITSFLRGDRYNIGYLKNPMDFNRYEFLLFK